MVDNMKRKREQMQEQFNNPLLIPNLKLKEEQEKGNGKY